MATESSPVFAQAFSPLLGQFQICETLSIHRAVQSYCLPQGAVESPFRTLRRLQTLQDGTSYRAQTLYIQVPTAGDIDFDNAWGRRETYCPTILVRRDR